LTHTALVFDHLAVVAPDVEAGVAHVRAQLGVDVPPGGTRPLMGTRNHLMQIGDACFLEIIAIDREAPAPQWPRWFNLDRRGDAPARLEYWLLGTKDLDASIAEANNLGGRAVAQTRGELSWRIAVQADGSLPLGGGFPGFLQWPEGSHPAISMANLGCHLVEKSRTSPTRNSTTQPGVSRMNPDKVSVMNRPAMMGGAPSRRTPTVPAATRSAHRLACSSAFLIVSPLRARRLPRSVGTAPRPARSNS